MTRRSFTLETAALALLAAIAQIMLVLIGHSSGREIGRTTTNGNTTTFYDNLGRETGRASRRGNGTTFYDNFGRETGRVSRGR